jgi:hypothetical protein
MLCTDCIGKYIACCVILNLVDELLKPQHLNEIVRWLIFLGLMKVLVLIRLPC